MAHPSARIPSRPIGFAHRGARLEARENTIAAFRRALALGAVGLESDVWVTADGEVVLDHDGTVRTGWRRRSVASLTRAELPAHVPTLGELYASCGTGFALSLDLKAPGAGPAVVAAAERAGAVGALWLCHSDPAVLRDLVHRTRPGHVVHSSRLDRLGAPLDQHARSLGAAGVAALNLRAREWSPERVDVVHRAGVAAFGWGAETRAELDRLLDAGADAVYSDHVPLMVAALADRHA